jgi:hypothetical protein
MISSKVVVEEKDTMVARRVRRLEDELDELPPMVKSPNSRTSHDDREGLKCEGLGC